VSDVEFGLRLRYEIRRQFAPYVGVVWSRRFGGYAALKDRPPFLNQQFVAGLRIWF
jgi:copper resistance protein B